MRGYCRLSLLVFAFMSAASAWAGTAFQATTTLTEQTSNNTSAANTFTAQVNNNLGASNISKVPLRTLLYPGSTAKIYVHLMPWFGFGDHMNIGYTSNDPVQVQKQVTDLVSRGADGAIIDWFGQGTLTHKYSFYDQVVQEFMQQAELRANFSFAVMDDAGSLKTCSTTAGCDITQTLISDLTYVYNTYENSPAYLHYNNQPVVYFFGHEAYPTLDWNQIRASVPGNPLFIFRNTGGFSYAQSNGAFSWVAPETVSTTDPMALTYLDSFDKMALSRSTTYATVSGYKGFNDVLAAWGTGRLIQQQCGQTWLTSMAESGKFYSASQQALGIQLVTWNDYEEGTELETGIDNCVTLSAAVSGTVVNWSITGQVNTVDHFTVYASQDGENLMWLADEPTSASSLDLKQFQLNSGNYTVFVQAVGKPSLSNKMSAAAALTIPNQPPVVAFSISPTNGYSPVTVAASTAGSFDSDGTVSSSTINFGDGVTASGTTASHTYSLGGTYSVIATVTDNLGASSSASATVAVKNPEVIISSPVNGATLSSPVHVAAQGFSGLPVSSMQVLVDGKLSFSAASASLDTTVSIAPGTHTLTVTGTDSSNRNFSNSLSLTIPDPGPKAVISVSSASILVGGSITASTTGSSAASGSITSTRIDFGDGTIVNAASAVHQYKAAGTFTVKATVTDNFGVSSTASITVVVKPQYVIITSPAGGTISTSTVRVTGTSYSGYSIASTQVYLDGVKKYQSSTNSVDISLALSKGSHLICVQGWDASGATFKAFVTVTR